MSDAPSFREELISQIPALQVLQALGYRYLTPAEALAARGDRLGNVLLDDILAAQLRRLNRIRHKGRDYPFSEANIAEAIRRLKDEPYDGLVRTSERLYDLLTLGISLPQTIEGDTRGFTLRYVDWRHPERNAFHVSDEFVVRRGRSDATRRPDIVLFVNGIPLAMLECKRPDLATGDEKPVDKAIGQFLRYQRDDEIPHLFAFGQVLLAVSTNDARYATTGTPRPFWSVWAEEGGDEAALHRLVNTPLGAAVKHRLYDHREHAGAVRAYFDAQAAAGERLPTAQDRAIVGLLAPARLLELAYQFVVYDAGVKKLARYQQYFAIKATVARVAALNLQGRRTGGVIWHTTGSGKSLTMVMLAKALALHPAIADPRLVLVTDRVDLDDQLWGTFRACGKTVHKARSGADLVAAVQRQTKPKADIVTTVINKFESAVASGHRDDDPNIFVLVDESHRSQYGTFHAMMRRLFPAACYIGLTGTPLTKAEKATVAKFGDFIHTYPMQRAVADGAVVPLLYEGRLAELDVERERIDQWFERVTRRLSDEQQRDLKRKFSRAEEVSRAEQRIQQIAYDISEHFVANVRGSGLKGQLAADSKASALLYKKYLDEFGEVTSEVVISPPDTREGGDEVDDEDVPALDAFWRRMMARFGTEDRYNKELRSSFGREDGVELLIVVDKLLTGFDEPRNAVLYIDKPLREHALLQAIARVNRVYPGKEHGLIVDYRGVLGELNAALNTYHALAAFDGDDVAGIVTDVAAEVARLPQLHAVLWDVFKEVPNRRDTEALERFLAPEDRRQRFYEALAAYTRGLKVALGTVRFYEATPEGQVDRYKADLAFFHNLRVSVRRRYAEVVDYRDYERQIRTLLNRHIAAETVAPLTALVDIFDREAFAAEVERVVGPAAQADTIASRVRRALSERLEQDPVAYRRFSQLLEETIAAYRAGRLDEAEYLHRMRGVLAEVQRGAGRGVPPQLLRYQHARAYYGVVEEVLGGALTGALGAAAAEEVLAEVAIHVERLIEGRKIRDWAANRDVHRAMMNDIEDYLYAVKDLHGIPLTASDLDLILDRVVELARRRDRL